jgi:hypothetical protein
MVAPHQRTVGLYGPRAWHATMSGDVKKDRPPRIHSGDVEQMTTVCALGYV